MADPKPPTHEEMREVQRIVDEHGLPACAMTIHSYIAAAEQVERTLRESAVANERLRDCVRAREAETLAALAERDELKAKLADAERALVDLKTFGVGCHECGRLVPIVEAYATAIDVPTSGVARAAYGERVKVHVPGTFHKECCEPAGKKYAAQHENARLAAVLREHGPAIREAIAVALNDDEIDEVEENCSDMFRAAAKAVEEALK